MKTNKVGEILSKCILIGITILAIIPFYLMTIMSTHESQDVVTKLHLLPGEYFIHNAEQVFKSGFLRFYWNSFYIAVSAAFIGVLMSAMAGYALSKYQFKLRKAIFNFVILTMMIPFGVSIVGYLIEMRALGLTNTHVPMIVQQWSVIMAPFC